MLSTFGISEGRVAGTENKPKNPENETDNLGDAFVRINVFKCDSAHEIRSSYGMEIGSPTGGDKGCGTINTVRAQRRRRRELLQWIPSAFLLRAKAS
jgi:hypothetical protein